MNSNKFIGASPEGRGRGARSPLKLPATSSALSRIGSSLKSIGSAALRGIMGTVSDHLPLFVVVSLVTGLFFFAVQTVVGYLAMPEVHQSYLEQKCVEVVNADGSAGSCDKLPKRYHTIWVK